MTGKIMSVSSMQKKAEKTTSRSEAEQAAVRELVKAAWRALRIRHQIAD